MIHFLTIIATAYQSPILAPVMYNVQLDKIIVPFGKDAGGHTLAHSFEALLAKRHRT
jgi:hypothetical protein